MKYTLEEFDFRDDCLMVELDISYSVCPGDPGCRYDRDGGGYPPTAPVVEDVQFRVLSAEGAERTYAGEDLVAIQQAVDAHYDNDGKFRDRVDECCFEEAGERDSEDPNAYERWRDDRDERRERLSQIVD